MNTNSSNSEANYLHYVILDDGGKVRGHMIGVQHWVEPKDQNLNPDIMKAITHSARVILEIPPNAKAPLLPPESEYKSFKQIIIDAKLEASSDSNLSSTPLNLENEIEKLLKEIEDKSVQAGDKDREAYSEMKKVVDDLPSNAQKLRFLKIIQEHLFDFNLVSFEININKIIDGHIKWKPLEKEDLNKKLLDAKIKLGLRKIEEAKKAEKIPEVVYNEVIEKVTNIKSDQEKLDFINKRKEELGIREPERNLIKEQAIKEGLYRAWVDGNVDELKKWLKIAFDFFKEEPEFDEVHQPRDQQMAERIVKIMKKAKNAKTEETLTEETCTFIMGCAHLVQEDKQRNRRNIIDYLSDNFTKDLQGWSIQQVKIK